MKVLYISHDGASSGGASLALVNFIEDAINLGLEPVVLIPKFNGLEKLLDKMKVPYIKFYYGSWVFEKSENHFINIKRYFFTLIKQIISLFFLFKNLSKIKNEKFEYIHTNSSVVGIGCYMAIILKVKHIFHVREFGEEHHNFKFILGTKYTRKFMECTSDKMIVISNSLKDKYVKYVKRENIEVIYDGLPLNYINKREYEDKDEFNLLISGTIQKGKGQLDIIKAINKLNNPFIKLYVAGPIGNLEYGQKLNRYIEENNLNKNVIILGNVEDMNSIRKFMDAEMINSYMEAFGRVTVEAMLSKMPIIASKSGANTELVIHNFNGLLYEYSDIDEIVKNINYLYENRTVGYEMGQNGFEIAINKYTQRNNTIKILELYKTLNKR